MIARPRRRGLRLLALMVAASAVAGVFASGVASARPERPGAAARPRAAATNPVTINGQGSTYVAPAMYQWQAGAKARGLQVNYTPTGSPAGLGAFQSGVMDYAGTEAEFASLDINSTVPRGYQYVPDVGGAVAVMYNLDDRAGHHVDYLHLSRATIAKIFTGTITSWSDPQISRENKGFKFPDKPITVVYRGGQSGTTALFYDFVAHADPATFTAWARRVGANTSHRIIQLDSLKNPFPNAISFNDSNQIADYLDRNKWAIGYDEFGYKANHNVLQVAWVDNAAGHWTQPYALNIATALKGAALRPDLSQELSGVYSNGDPQTYPISAYSYLVTQCAPRGDRPTCKGPYRNAGVTEALKRWMSYIACDGQVQMAATGYSPLPPNLSQEIMNSVARMTGNPADNVTLSAANCSNPRFRGTLGANSVNPSCDPYACGNVQQAPAGGSGGVAADPNAAGGGGTNGTGAGQGGTGPSGTGGGGTSTTSPGGSGSDGGSSEQAAAVSAQQAAQRARAAGAGRTGGSAAVGGGSLISRKADPHSYKGDKSPNLGGWPLLVLLVVLATPVGIGMVLRRRRGASGPF